MRFLYILLFISLFTLGCSANFNGRGDYSTKDCDINYRGKCVYKKRLSKEEAKDIPILYLGYEDCSLITPDDGCIKRGE